MSPLKSNSRSVRSLTLVYMCPAKIIIHSEFSLSKTTVNQWNKYHTATQSSGKVKTTLAFEHMLRKPFNRHLFTFRRFVFSRGWWHFDRFGQRYVQSIVHTTVLAAYVFEICGLLTLRGSDRLLVFLSHRSRKSVFVLE